MCASPPRSRCRKEASSPVNRSGLPTRRLWSAEAVLATSTRCVRNMYTGYHVTMDLQDPTTFASAYAQHARSVHAAAMRVLGDPTRAQDVVQDVFARVWARPGRYDARR